MDIHKRELLLNDDIMNTNTLNELGESSTLTTSTEKKEQIPPDNISNSNDKKSVIIDELKATNKTVERETKEEDEGDEEDASGVVATNASGEKRSFGDESSGYKESSADDETSSGESTESGSSIDDIASGSKRFTIELNANQIEGDFGEEEGEEKRETRNIADDVDENSGDKAGSAETSSADNGDNDDETSGDINIIEKNAAAQIKDSTTIVAAVEKSALKNFTLLDEAKSTNEKRSNIIGIILANNTIAAEPQDVKKDIIKENTNTETVTNIKKEVINKNNDDSHNKVVNENDDDIDSDDDKTGDDDNVDDTPSVKKAKLIEGVAKKAVSDEVSKRTVLYAADDAANQKAVIKNENDVDDSFKTKGYHVVVASKKTVVPEAANTTNLNASTTANVIAPSEGPIIATSGTPSNMTEPMLKKGHRKSKVRHHHHHHLYTPEILETGDSNKRVEEDATLPDAFTNEGEEDEDKALINAPEPTYLSQIPGLEASTIERYADEGQEAMQERDYGDHMDYQNPILLYARNQLGRNDDYDTLRRHFILEHSGMQRLPYTPGIMSGYNDEQEERPGVFTPSRAGLVPSMMYRDTNMIRENGMVGRSGNMFMPTNSIINEQYGSGLPASNQDVVSAYRPANQYLNQYQQQAPIAAPMEQSQYLDRYNNNGLEENGPQGYVPDNQNQVQGTARSFVHHYRRPSDSYIKVPATVVSRFIKNAAQIYQFGDELVRHSPALMGNTRTGIPRSSVSSRIKSNNPVVLQPIVVFMPYGRSK